MGRTFRIEVLKHIGQPDGVTAEAVSLAIRSATAGDTIDVVISSPGGSAYEALAVYSLLRKSPARKEVLVLGLAASAASIIMLAGDRRRVVPAAATMLHDPYAAVVGTASDMDRMGKALRLLTRSIVDIYSGRTGQPADRLERMMREETWLSAEQAVELGFFHSIDRQAKADARAWDLRGTYKHAPAAFTVPGGQRPTFGQPSDDFQRIAACIDAGGAFTLPKGVSEMTTTLEQQAVEAQAKAEFEAAGGYQAVGCTLPEYIRSRLVDEGVCTLADAPDVKADPVPWLGSGLDEPIDIS